MSATLLSPSTECEDCGVTLTTANAGDMMPDGTGVSFDEYCHRNGNRDLCHECAAEIEILKASHEPSNWEMDDDFCGIGPDGYEAEE